MKQYEFVIRKGKATWSVNCTSQTVEKARKAVRDAYSPEFTIDSQPVTERKPHYFFSEIDATA